MLLPQIKEREHRFRLALRIGFPIFSLIILLISSTIISTQESLSSSFYFISVILFVFSIYFILFLIYNGSTIKITDPITETFTREYLFNFLKKDLKQNNEYALILISVENLNNINDIYGLKNGDKVLKNVAKWIGEYFEAQNIHNFPLGHIKGGDFILGLNGSQNDYNTMLDLMCIKSEKLKVDDIEVILSAVITDSRYSKKLDHLIENLYEIQKQKDIKTEKIDPNDLEMIVIQAIKDKKITIKTQNVFFENSVKIVECSVKLYNDNKIIHQKEYMKVINRLGFEVEFDLIILETILQEADKNIIYAFSISPRSLRNSIFVSKAKELLINLKESRFKIMFILNELEYYPQISKYNSIIKSFKDLGVLITIDRLGSLHTSFLYLRELDIDVVRFDSTYSKKSDKYKDIIDGLNFMAHKKGVKTWIKMIENKDIYDMANNLNIDYKQGKFLASVK